MFIYSYNEASEGAKELAQALGVKRIKHENSKFVGSRSKNVINWGLTRLPDEIMKCRIINTPDAVTSNSNKLRFFQHIEDDYNDKPRIPDFTADEELAKTWVSEGHVVVARTTLTGHSGEGIHFMELSQPESFVSAPLYTRYVKKKDEFRVHFINKKIVDIQRKALRAGENPNVNWRVRNLANGFIYARNGLTVPEDVTVQADKFIGSTALDFGALDLIYNEKDRQAYILEVNCAPGLTGETVTNYANGFREFEV